MSTTQLSQAEIERAHMQRAYASWDEKEVLVKAFHEAAADLAANIFLEYRDIRGCSVQAAHREAREWIERYMSAATAGALNRLHTLER